VIAWYLGPRVRSLSLRVNENVRENGKTPVSDMPSKAVDFHFTPLLISAHLLPNQQLFFLLDPDEIQCVIHSTCMRTKVGVFDTLT
jgi:hypothetical protein